MGSDAFDRDWMVRGRCVGMDPEAFFPNLPGRNGRAQAEKAAAICRSCPVIRECAAYQKATHSGFGVWGGNALHEQRRAS